MEQMQDPIDYRDLVEQAGDAIIASNAEGAIVLWNAGATRIFGFSASEALGQNLDIIVPDRLRARHWTGYDASMASGTTKYGTTLLKVPAINKNGQTLSIAFTVSMLKTNGKVTHVVAFIRDETARWNEERELRKRLRTLEEAAGQPGGGNNS